MYTQYRKGQVQYRAGWYTVKQDIFTPSIFALSSFKPNFLCVEFFHPLVLLIIPPNHIACFHPIFNLTICNMQQQQSYNVDYMEGKKHFTRNLDQTIPHTNFCLQYTVTTNSEIPLKAEFWFPDLQSLYQLIVGTQGFCVLKAKSLLVSTWFLWTSQEFCCIYKYLKLIHVHYLSFE